MTQRRSVDGLRVAPSELLRGDEVVEALAWRLHQPAEAAAAAVSRDRSVLLVHGTIGYPRVRERLGAALRVAGVEAFTVLHEGPCHAAAMDAIASAAEREGVGWLLGVGGGRVIDAAKGAAHQAGLPFAALPTSPATCAATAATVVVYDAHGSHLAVREGGPAAALCALDADLLAAAPDRLLAAGIADAWAKVHEVRLTSRGGAVDRSTARAALALLDDLAALLTEHALAALAAGPAGRRDLRLLPRRRLVAEAVVTYPGLIGGLAGADAKLALAHPLHDALTGVPGSHGALHGEKVAFGSLVQIRLAGRDGSERSDAERTAAMRAEAATYAHLGVTCHLAALGCGAARSGRTQDSVVERTLADPCVAQALPSLNATQLRAAIREVDGWLRQQASVGP